MHGSRHAGGWRTRPRPAMPRYAGHGRRRGTQGSSGIIAGRDEGAVQPAGLRRRDRRWIAPGGPAARFVGLDLGAAVIAARQAGILETGGGHAMAAGFALAGGTHRIDFHAFLDERLAAATALPDAADLI